jgi:hypothetical protein
MKAKSRAFEGERRERRYLPTESLSRLTGAALFIDVSGPPPTARDHIVAELGRRLTTGTAVRP